MSIIYKERVKDILEFGAGRIISPITDDEIMELARIALASLEAEPVDSSDLGSVKFEYTGAGDYYGYGFYRDGVQVDVDITKPLYTAPPAPVSVSDVPFDENSPYDVSCSMPSNLRELIAEEIGILFSDDDAQSVWDVCRRAAMLHGADGTLTNEGTKQVGELVMWIKRLAHSLRKSNPDSKLQSDAMDYLSRKGLISVKDILR